MRGGGGKSNAGRPPVSAGNLGRKFKASHPAEDNTRAQQEMLPKRYPHFWPSPCNTALPNYRHPSPPELEHLFAKAMV